MEETTENLKITFEDKEALNTNTEIPEKNKITAENVNEIKKVVNNMSDKLIFDTTVIEVEEDV